MSSIEARGKRADGSAASLISATMFAVIRVKRRLVIGGAKDLDLRVRIALEALDHDKVDGFEQAQKLGQRRLGRAAQFPHRARSGWRKRPAPRERLRRDAAWESLPGWSRSKLWWACLIVETLKPLRLSSGMSLTISVVLPAPLHPAKPITRMGWSSHSRAIARYVRRRPRKARTKRPENAGPCVAAV